jgi:hypothetical protein
MADKPATEAPPAPRLVGDDPPSPKASADEGGAPGGGISEEVGPEAEGDQDAPVGDPATRLAAFEQGSTALGAVLDRLAPNIILRHTDPIAAAMVLLDEQAGALLDARRDLEALQAAGSAFQASLTKRGSPPEEGETLYAAAWRIIHGLDGAAEELARELAMLTADPAKAAAIEAKKAHAKAEKGEVAVLADLPDTASLTLRFAEDDDRFIATIAPIAIERRELSAFGGRGVLERAIDFPPDSPPAHIRSAWLIAGAKAVKCELHPGIRIGGGSIVKIPKGHLVF